MLKNNYKCIVISYINYEEDYEEYITLPWTRLLDQLLHTGEVDLGSVQTQEIQCSLDLLQKVHKITEEYFPEKMEVIERHWAGDTCRYWKPNYSPGLLVKARYNLLSKIEDKHFKILRLNKEDKRFYEAKLKEEIQKVENLNQAIQLYEKHIHSSLLQHRRHHIVDTLISKFFRAPMKYSTLKSNFILALQEKALSFVDSSMSLQHLLSSIFDRKHFENGLIDMYYKFLESKVLKMEANKNLIELGT